MKHISILVPQGALLGSIEGPRQVFSEVNTMIEDRLGKGPMFKVQLVAFKKDVPVYDGLYTINPDALTKDISKTDLIIIPALAGDVAKAVQENEEFIPWIIRQHHAGAEVASLCIGAFLLAATGLVNGKKVATHWMAADAFRKAFPEVELVEDKILTDENGIYSSGGAFSYLNLLLYLIEKYAGRELSVLAAKTFQIDIDRKSQSPFMMFQGQKSHEDETIHRAQDFIEKNVQEKISVDQLATMLALSRRNLERRFKKATSNTVVEYIQRVRVEAAKQNLESSRDNVNEVMYKVGYTDSKAFRSTFKRITGLSPVQYRNKYNRLAMSEN
ncbi:helix-turn-helix domain-containing protein [Pseudoflavitalea sp. G-6-1-2]|uniref:GlxA family transcriptional regulator n=1 Tax=Pseudoflavitalea sp. G-6-1-2 TaxID=2728841 RepID=UPI00146EF79B|nr:helix-turn-helix domain-containing protein [Pseudoflavitalea sp. G-6-1-2]NML20270.1 helix-turn-helix domain-containing protein [Pseudoflavitalea sp. G-6-1-2]